MDDDVLTKMQDAEERRGGVRKRDGKGCSTGFQVLSGHLERRI